MDSFAELREAIESVKLVDAHAHNLVALDSNIPFISCFSEATGDALLDAPHTLSFKGSLREIAELYGCEPSLLAVVEHRVSSGLEAIASKCFEAANVSAVLIDDGLKLDKMFDIDWHTNLAPTVGAKGARKVLFSVLCDACKNGELSVAEAVEAAQDIFAQNAIRFYKIDAASNSVRCKDVQSLLLVDSQDKNSNKVSLVRLLWVDASGQHRCRVIPRKRFYDVVKTSGVGLAQASMAMSSFSDGPSDGSNLTATGEIRLMPDFSTKQKIPWVNQEEMVLANMHLKPGNPWDYCPRETLRRVCSALKDEFNLLHAESGNGQFEIPLGHTICTKAADNLIFARETIKAVARKQGLLATFIPKYSLEDIGSGCHVHISLWENGKNVFMGSPGSSKNGISVIGEKFMAGVLCHLPSILAFTAPIPNSYDRIQPNTWSGAYLCWGKENREAPLRTACPPGIPDGVVSNFEIKSFDACANPHLGLSAIIAAGIDGLRRNLTLPDPIDENPATRNLKMLPRSLSESLEALQSDTMLRDLIGENLVVAVEAVRKAEINHYSKNKDAWMQLIHRY
ncbi:hypothetical protein QQ045_017757 [Rhodiola kirilowii]